MTVEQIISKQKFSTILSISFTICIRISLNRTGEVTIRSRYDLNITVTLSDTGMLRTHVHMHPHQ